MHASHSHPETAVVWFCFCFTTDLIIASLDLQIQFICAIINLRFITGSLEWKVRLKCGWSSIYTISNYVGYGCTWTKMVIQVTLRLYIYISYRKKWRYLGSEKNWFKYRICHLLSNFGPFILTPPSIFPYCKMGILIVFAYENNIYQ